MHAFKIAENLYYIAISRNAFKHFYRRGKQLFIRLYGNTLGLQSNTQETIPFSLSRDLSLVISLEKWFSKVVETVSFFQFHTMFHYYTFHVFICCHSKTFYALLRPSVVSNAGRRINSVSIDQTRICSNLIRQRINRRNVLVDFIERTAKMKYKFNSFSILELK